MKNIKSTWTREELKVYTLLFLMNSNLNKEIQIQISNAVLDKMHNEFYLDNDYQSIQKICSAVEQKNYSRHQLQEFLIEIRNLINWAKKDKRFTLNNWFNGLERILISTA